MMLRLPTIIAWALALAASGCVKGEFDAAGGLVQYDAGVGVDGAIRPHKPVLRGEVAPVYGFVSAAEQVEYYYLGEVEPVGGQVATNPIYLFYDKDDKPLFRLNDAGDALVGWHPVVNILPTETGYSPYFRVHKVTVDGSVNPATIDALKAVVVPAKRCQMDAICQSGERCIEQACRASISIGDYQLDAIKSFSTLKQSGLAISETDTVINCPIVDANAKLLKGISAPDTPFPKLQLWYKRLRAFCFLVEGGQPLFGTGTPATPLTSEGRVKRDKAYFIRQQLSFGTAEKISVLPERNLVITERLPKDGYSSLVEEHYITVGKQHEFSDVRSLKEAQDDKLPIARGSKLHNLAVRGTIPKCSSDDDCKNTGGKVDPPLKCSPETGYCSPPFARLYEECRRGVKECDPKGGPGGEPLACVGLRVRDKFFCFHACDSRLSDENPDPDIDTRCGSKSQLQCFALRSSPGRPNGVCIQRCNSRAGDKQSLLAQCVAPTCGNGKLEHGETCDDGNTVSGDGCNEFCTLSTFERCESQGDCRGQGQTCQEPVVGQGAMYCLPAADKEKDERADQDKYRTICMEFDYCWPPDDRADWLGKKDEEVGQ